MECFDLGEYATYEDFLGFRDPAYTYIIRLPFRDWRGLENGLQHVCTPAQYRELLDVDDSGHTVFDDAPDNTDTAALLHFLARNGPQWHYGRFLIHCARQAVEWEFRNKQGRRDPEFSCFCQLELSDTMHIHLVLGGPGLNKYNAKAWRNVIAYRFFNYMLDGIKQNLGHLDAVEYQNIIHPLVRARNSCVLDYTECCSILQYKSRRGDMYACRVDGKEFIVNYLLCKNLKYNQHVDPQTITPIGAHFIEATKSYAISSIDGKLVPEHMRRQIFERLKKITDRSLEPVFGGDPYGDLPKVEKAEWLQTTSGGGRMTKREGLMLDCMRRCFSENITSYEEMVGKCPDLTIMIESQAGGSRLIEQVMGMTHIKIVQSYTALGYMQKLFGERAQLKNDNRVFRLLNFQGYNPWQAGHWVCCVLDKKSGKQNTLCFYGPASTGKTNLAKSIVQACKLYGCVNHQNKNFVFNDCAAKLIVWWEEALMHTDYVEQAKCILGGTEFRIDRKNKDSMLLPKTPVIISSNNDLYTVVGGNIVSQVHSKPLRERIVQLNFMKMLEPTFGEITPEETAAWLLACRERFDCTLEGFYREWDLQVTPNVFPIGNLCPSHSQDWTLHERGFCSACGGYYPLETREDDLFSLRGEHDGEWTREDSLFWEGVVARLSDNISRLQKLVRGANSLRRIADERDGHRERREKKNLSQPKDEASVSVRSRESPSTSL